MKTLEQILIDVNSYLDLTAELPTGDDLSVRTNFAKQAVQEWSNAARWRQLKQSSSYLVTSATLSLPSNFRAFIAPPRENTYTEYPEIMLEELGGMSAVDKYCYVTGSSAQGHTLFVNGLPDGGTTISFEWMRFPSNFATLSSVCEVPDTDFVKWKVISYVLQSRLDERFPIVDAEAKRILSNMIGAESIQTPGGSLSVRRYGAAAWRIGRRNG